MKKRTMNELRQTKEYRLSDQGGEYTVPCKCAEPKNVESYKNEQGPSPGFIKVQEEAKDYYEDVQKDLDKAAAEGSTRHWPKEVEGSTEAWFNTQDSRDYTTAEPKYKDIAGDPDLLESVKKMIVDKVVKDLDDIIFEMICKEMGDNYMFQSRNYLTEAGCELFEEQFFEFYHEHHGEILYKVLKNITNG